MSIHARKDIILPRRSAFTILELLVTFGIVALLISLLAPAIQGTRERARVLDCRGRMRQVALAAHAFHEARGSLPTPLLSMASPTFPRMLSPWAHILPQLDQTALFQSIEQLPDEAGVGLFPGMPVMRREGNNRVLATPLPVVRCPSDPGPPVACNFRATWGNNSGAEVQGLVQRKNVGIWFPVRGQPQQPPRFQVVEDGLSQTALLSERIVGDFDSAHYSPARDTYYFERGDLMVSSPDEYATLCASRFTNPLPGELSFGGATWLLAGKAFTLYNHVLPPNSPIPDCSGHDQRLYDSATTARSWHRGGVNLALADGSVRLVAESVDLTVWRALGSRAGHELSREE